MGIREAYLAGYDAAVAGLRLTQNPHTDDLWNVWNQGHMDGLDKVGPEFKEKRIEMAQLVKDFTGA
jgi:hypothetical protein